MLNRPASLSNHGASCCQIENVFCYLKQDLEHDDGTKKELQHTKNGHINKECANSVLHPVTHVACKSSSVPIIFYTKVNYFAKQTERSRRHLKASSFKLSKLLGKSVCWLFINPVNRLNSYCNVSVVLRFEKSEVPARNGYLGHFST